MDIGDERILDGYEGVDTSAVDAGAGDGVPVSIRPKVQGDGSYNKWFVGANVVKWLDGAEGFRAGLDEGKGRCLFWFMSTRIVFSFRGQSLSILRG
jgi:hypothetical protein